MSNAPIRATWMMPGAPRVQKPSWLKLAPVAAPVEAAPPVVEVIPSAPPREMRPSMTSPPPSSRRIPPPQIQTTRELELESEALQLRSELTRVVAESETTKARVMEESEPAIVALAMAIAKRVVARELTAEPTLVHAWVREARGLMPKGRVFVAPDVEGVEGADVDPMLAPATAELRDGASVIAVGADARLAAIADALGIDP